MPRVFISYSHDSEPHREAVLRLAQQLRAWGIDVVLDRFAPAPAEGWPRWMMAQVESAEFVLVVCTATYRRRFEGQEDVGVGKGATFEGLLATQHLYDGIARNTRFIPVVFAGTPETDIPTVLRPYQRYTLPIDADAHPEQLEPLVRHLTGQPEIVAAPLGPRKILPPRGAQPPAASPSAPAPPAIVTTRRALAPAPVLSGGGADVRVEPLELIRRLLVSLFPTGEGFRQWVSLGPDGDVLVAEFPGSSASASALIHGGLEVLRRRGYLDGEFFARLRSSYSRRHDDIERAAAAWGAPLAALAAAPSSNPALASPPPATNAATSHGGLHFANTGNVTIHVQRDLVAGDQHITTSAVPPTDPRRALAALRAALISVAGPDQNKLTRALDELAEELDRSPPDRDDAREVLGRLSKLIDRNNLTASPSVAPHLAALSTWAGT